MSTIDATANSDWPIPTVSTMTTSNPAASTRVMVCAVVRATPPSVPAVGDGRTNARASTANDGIRVLSPSTLPPVRTLDGSMASTPTR